MKPHFEGAVGDSGFVKLPAARRSCLHLDRQTALYTSIWLSVIRAIPTHDSADGRSIPTCHASVSREAGLLGCPDHVGYRSWTPTSAATFSTIEVSRSTRAGMVSR